MYFTMAAGEAGSDRFTVKCAYQPETARMMRHILKEQLASLPGVRDVATNPLVRILLHLALVPVVVGVTYEFNRFVGAHDNVVTRILSAPGMWMQNFTTNEPDDAMIEVAIEAMKLVIPDEKGKDQW